MPKPVPFVGPGGEAHEAGIFVVCQLLQKDGWEVKSDTRLFVGMFDGSRVPDVYATKRIKGKFTRLIIEVETHNRQKEMKERIKYYIDTYPPKADRFVEIPLYKLSKEEQDNLPTLRKFIGAYL